VVNSGSRGAATHKTYHGRTGVVWNVTNRAIGVEINKRVLGRFLRKRIHVRVEHLRPSRCRLDFIRRSQENQMLQTMKCAQKGKKK
jgi:large subunit ribosomal protein L21e